MAAQHDNLDEPHETTVDELRRTATMVGIERLQLQRVAAQHQLHAPPNAMSLRRAACMTAPTRVRRSARTMGASSTTRTLAARSRPAADDFSTRPTRAARLRSLSTPTPLQACSVRAPGSRDAAWLAERF